MLKATEFTAPLYLGWSESEQKTFRDWLSNLLRTEIVTINFIKRDGSERLMRCSLHESFLPATTGNSKSEPNINSISVWDLDASAWRSFRFDSIRQISFELGEIK